MKKFSVYNNRHDNINQIVESIIYETDIDIIEEGIMDWFKKKLFNLDVIKSLDKKSKARLLAVYAASGELDEEGSEKGKINKLTKELTSILGIPYNDNDVKEIGLTIDGISKEITGILAKCSKNKNDENVLSAVLQLLFLL
jgi:hypothetical protein